MCPFYLGRKPCLPHFSLPELPAACADLRSWAGECGGLILRL